jgi:hypothetical protein
MGFINSMKKLSITFRETINLLFNNKKFNISIASNLNNKVLDEFEKNLFFGFILEEFI